MRAFVRMCMRACVHVVLLNLSPTGQALARATNLLTKTYHIRDMRAPEGIVHIYMRIHSHTCKWLVVCHLSHPVIVLNVPSLRNEKYSRVMLLGDGGWAKSYSEFASYSRKE